MDEWFVRVAEIRNPDREHLALFLDEVMRLLEHTLKSEEAQVLWALNPELRGMAMEAYETDVRRGAEELGAAIRQIPNASLVQHGLIGRPARFKYNVMATVSRGWGRVRAHFTIRGGFRKVVEAVDAHLESFIAASGGVGGVVKEFKDALLALAPER
jgi:hypothetical protein